MFAAYLAQHVREDMFKHVQTMSNQSLMMIWPFQPVPSTFSCSKTRVFPAQNQIIQIFDGFPSCRSSFCHQKFTPSVSKSPKSPKSARECHFSPTFFCRSGHRTPLPRFAGSHGSIVVPHGPSAVGDLQGQIRDGFLQAASQRLGEKSLGQPIWKTIGKP